MMISVLMSIYSEKIDWIERAIESILNQTYKDFEFIIVNDCPQRKENINILQKYAKIDKRIKLIQNSENIGLTKSLNKAFCESSGEFIARMDADDISDKYRFEKQLAVFNQNLDIGVCGTGITEFGLRNKKRIFSQYVNSEPFLFESFFAHSTVMIRRSIIERLEIFYNIDYKYSQDFELWSRLFFVTNFYNIPESLLLYRISDMQISSGKAIEQNDLAIKIRRKFIASFIKQTTNENINLNDWNLIEFKILENSLKLFPNLNKSGFRLHLVYMYKALLSKDRLFSLWSILRHISLGEIKVIDFFKILRFWFTSKYHIL